MNNSCSGWRRRGTRLCVGVSVGFSIAGSLISLFSLPEASFIARLMLPSVANASDTGTQSSVMNDYLVAVEAWEDSLPSQIKQKNRASIDHLKIAISAAQKSPDLDGHQAIAKQYA